MFSFLLLARRYEVLERDCADGTVCSHGWLQRAYMDVFTAGPVGTIPLQRRLYCEDLDE